MNERFCGVWDSVSPTLEAHARGEGWDNMATVIFDDFAELYRAAYAECDPERKSRLLSEVQQALAEWELKSQDSHFWPAPFGDSRA